MSDRIEVNIRPGIPRLDTPPLKTEDLRKAIAFLNEGRPDHDAAATQMVKLNRGSRSVGLAAVNARVGLGSRLKRDRVSGHRNDSTTSEPYCRRFYFFVA